MSNSENRKSMDDVLASIRRIVRAEKQTDAEPAEELDDGPVPQEVTQDGPLELTDDMRMQEAPDHAAIAQTIVAPATEQGEVTDMDEGQIREIIREVVSDEIANGDMNGLVRDIIRDELTTGQIGGNISKNVLRLIQAEVAKTTG